MKIGIAIREEPDFHFIHHLPHLLLVQQQCGDNDQRGAIAGNALAEVELWQWLGIKYGSDSIVDQLHSALHGRHDHEQKCDCETSEDRVIRQQRKDSRGDEEYGDELDAGYVEVVRVAADKGAEPQVERGMEVDVRRKLCEPSIQKVIADVAAALLLSNVFIVPLGTFSGKFEHLCRDLGFCKVGMARDQRHSVPIHLACVQVHLWIGSGWILTKRSVECDERFKNAAPLGIRGGSQT